jgi:glycosyltransferase involved in cell wall biosynthesis
MCAWCGGSRDSGGVILRTAILAADTLGNGGAERQLSLLAASNSARWRYVVWSMDGGPFRQVLHDSGVEVHVCARSGRFDISPIQSLMALVRDSDARLVHSWGWMSSLAGAAVARRAGIPLVNGSIRRGAYNPLKGRATQLGLAMADVVVANSFAGLRSYSFGNRRGRVVRNGVGPGTLARCADLRAGLAVGTGQIRLAMVARFVREKDHDTLLDAVRMLGWGSEKVTCRIAGEGPTKARVVSDARELRDSGIVQFFEPGLDALPLMAGCDVGVLLNTRQYGEGCSNSILEYMACGMPVVCSDTGGNAEVVRDGITGCVVPPEDPRALATAIASLASDARLRGAMGAAGLEDVARRYTLEGMQRGFERIYSEVCDV